MKRLCILVLGAILISGSMAIVSAYDDVLPEVAYDMLNPDEASYVPNAYILDVRTPAEWNWVGHPGEEICKGNPNIVNGAFLEGKVINIPFELWVFDPETKQYIMELNKFFDEEVVRQFSPYDTVIIMCRSGSRSVSASEELEDPTHPACKRLEELGFYSIYNMQGGFEGGKDNCGYRTLDAGWKNKVLPYNYSTEGIWIPHQKGRSL
jgi:rhodanese-related sulfurtransferase